MAAWDVGDGRLAVKEDWDYLARRMQEGDLGAFGRFSEEFGPSLYRYYIYRGLSASHAEDLAVSALSDIAMRIDRYTPMPGGGLKGWVYRLAENKMIDEIRSSRPAAPLTMDPIAPGSFDSDADSRVSELVGAIQEVIGTLEEPDRSIVEARLSDPDRTFHEIGAGLGLKEVTARVRYHRALGKLGELLKKNPSVCAWREARS